MVPVYVNESYKAIVERECIICLSLLFICFSTSLSAELCHTSVSESDISQ